MIEMRHLEPNRKLAVVLIGHGSRRSSANQELIDLAQKMARDQQSIVEPAFLELAEPSIPVGIANAIDKGANLVVLAPFFLSSGRHAMEDLEDFRTQAESQYAGVIFKLADPLGPHRLLETILWERVGQAVSQRTENES